MGRIFIYGAPGAGKSSTSRYLKLSLNYPLIDGDFIKECIARLAKTEVEEPFLYVGAKEAWCKFGAFSEQNVIKGLMAARGAAKVFLDNELSLYGRNLILEGSMLDLHYSKLGKSFLIVTKGEDKHRRQFFKDRAKTLENEQSFQASRIIQEQLIKEANNHNIEIVSNTTGPADLSRELASRCR